jgi:organic hydroperoxide reductase OsmC/OhrA/ribosomal protein S18 acetylase RimI-like enzyme
MAAPGPFETSLNASSAEAGGLVIRELQPGPATQAELASLLIETVAGGGSVSFMHPLAPAQAAEFWSASLAAAARGERVVLGAWDGERLAGTVSLIVDLPPNQPHRAEIAKLMTRPAYRGRGLASALMAQAEARALALGRRLLVLDTASEGGAGGLYERLGYRFAGEIPDFALMPQGGLTGTRLYWKRIGPAQMAEVGPAAAAAHTVHTRPDRPHHTTVNLAWTGNLGRGTAGYRAYSRAHRITAPGKPALEGSSDPAFLGDASCWNPEELLLASLSACHQLWYLHLCAEAGIEVRAYEDEATATMLEQADGAGQFVSTRLRPQVTLAPGSDLTTARALHASAHQKCFIARSVNFPIAVDPSFLHADLKEPPN